MQAFTRRFVKSFANAAHGLAYLFKSQANARIELMITILVIGAGFILNISRTEWLVILIFIALVLGLEGINTAIEILSDKLHPEHDEEIRKVKDAAAGAVLLAALLAAIAGIVIFVPRLINIF